MSTWAAIALLAGLPLLVLILLLVLPLPKNNGDGDARREDWRC